MAKEEVKKEGGPNKRAGNIGSASFIRSASLVASFPLSFPISSHVAATKEDHYVSEILAAIDSCDYCTNLSFCLRRFLHSVMK
jgi:hypothetical protein